MNFARSRWLAIRSSSIGSSRKRPIGCGGSWGFRPCLKLLAPLIHLGASVDKGITSGMAWRGRPALHNRHLRGRKGGILILCAAVNSSRKLETAVGRSCAVCSGQHALQLRISPPTINSTGKRRGPTHVTLLVAFKGLVVPPHKIDLNLEILNQAAQLYVKAEPSIFVVDVPWSSHTRMASAHTLILSPEVAPGSLQAEPSQPFIKWRFAPFQAAASEAAPQDVSKSSPAIVPIINN